MKNLSACLAFAVLLSSTGRGRAQTPTPVVSNLKVTTTSSSALITFSSGVAAFAGVDYQPVGGAWIVVNEAWAVHHSISLTGLSPGTYNLIPWASAAPGVPQTTFQITSTSPASPAAQVLAAPTVAISNPQVINLSPTSATITFSSGIAAFGGVNLQPVNGSWKTINETTAVNHSLTLSGLTPGTQYNYMPWATGANGTPTSSFTTPVAAGVSASGTTNVVVGTTVIRSGLKNLGINIEGQNFYDSGQMLRNLTFRNPGFEGETWQSILHCASVTRNSCTDSNIWSKWPANFLAGATFQFIHGAADGQTGTVLGNTAANPSAHSGMTLTFSSTNKSPAEGDFVVVKKTVPGNAQAGWWPTLSGGATITTEFADLSPNTPGKQALSINAAKPGQSARIDSFFDSTNQRNFVLLNGAYQLTFRAKGLGGENQMTVGLERKVKGGTYFNEKVPLTSTWQEFCYTINASESSATAVGTVDLAFTVSGSSVLLDDVALTPKLPADAKPSPTAFRDEVVAALSSLHPGLLRYMDDGGPAFGSSIDNMLAPPFARQRSGSSMTTVEQDDVPLGLHEFLQLCQKVGAEPWYVLPPAISPAEMQNLIEYFAGSASTGYGSKRATLGQEAPWTSVFPVIHLELGNEEWNNVTFPGNAINDPVAYPERVTTVFGAARKTPGYGATSFDLIMGSQVVNPWYTGQEVAHASNYDSISVAPYLFGTFNDTYSTEAIFGPMFAQPEMWDSAPTGWMYQQAQAASSAGKSLVVYEENVSTQSGTAPQSMVDAVVPSVGGGVMMANHMLLQMRDLGVKDQCLWSLPGYSNAFTNKNGGKETTPIFGTVIDMGGQSNRRRPVFLAEQLVNSAILPNMLATTVSGADSTWNQPLSTNDSVSLNGAHEIQTFAFSDGARRSSLIVINLSRTSSRPVTFSGANAPTGSVEVRQLTSRNITDTNESAANVNSTSNTLTNFQPGSPFSLPPFSVTAFLWQK